ncbi:uncharacterized protein LOC143648121 [Tamandua tetradactyla]|uniref:uncharacterized protein LOC143648121 n=1 Tax=Tamandua tetradactyla TaxID=48850 RepID=UPI00405489B6
MPSEFSKPLIYCFGHFPCMSSLLLHRIRVLITIKAEGKQGCSILTRWCLALESQFIFADSSELMKAPGNESRSLAWQVIGLMGKCGLQSSHEFRSASQALILHTD